jgi:hypothetical protein
MLSSSLVNSLNPLMRILKHSKQDTRQSPDIGIGTIRRAGKKILEGLNHERHERTRKGEQERQVGCYSMILKNCQIIINTHLRNLRIV